MSASGHSAPVSVAAASPDHRFVASGGYDHAIVVWESRSGRVSRRIEGHTGLVNGLAWSPDGLWLASASSDRTARIFSPASGVERARLVGHADDVNAVRWSPDGRLIATASFDGAVRVFTRDGLFVRRFDHHDSDVNGVCWLPCGGALAAASDDGTVSVFDLATGAVRWRLRVHTDWVDAVAAHPTKPLLASASQDGTVAVFDLRDGSCVARLDDATCVVKDVAWSDDGEQLAATSYDGAIRVYCGESLALAAVHRADGLWNRSVAFGDGGVLTGSFGGGPVLVGERGARHYGDLVTHGLGGFVVTPGGTTVIACSDDGGLYEIDLRGGRAREPMFGHGAAVLCADLSPDGSALASGSWDRTVCVWDVRERQVLARLDDLGEPINSVGFGSGGDVWIGTFGGRVLRWARGASRATHVGEHHGSVKQIRAFGDSAVSVGRDGWVRRWPSGDGFVAGESILNGVALSKAVDRIATVSRRNGVEVFTPDGEQIAAFREHPCSAKCVAWAADDRTLAAGYYDGNVAIVEPDRCGARVRRIGSASVSQVGFAGDALVASTWDAAGTVHVLSRALEPRGVVSTQAGA